MENSLDMIPCEVLCLIANNLTIRSIGRLSMVNKTLFWALQGAFKWRLKHARRMHSTHVLINKSTYEIRGNFNVTMKYLNIIYTYTLSISNIDKFRLYVYGFITSFGSGFYHGTLYNSFNSNVFCISYAKYYNNRGYRYLYTIRPTSLNRYSLLSFSAIYAAIYIKQDISILDNYVDNRSDDVILTESMITN
jgi:hypothetical protein